MKHTNHHGLQLLSRDSLVLSGCFRRCHPKMAIVCGGSKAKSRITTQTGKEEFGFFRCLPGRIPWEIDCPGEKRRPEDQLLFRDDPLHTRDSSIPMSWNSSKGSKKLA